MTGRTYTRADLVAAYLDARRWHNAAPELRDWHAARYEAIADIFGAQLDKPPADGDFALGLLVGEVVASIEGNRSPFSNHLEVPESFIPYIERNAARIAPLQARVADELRGMLADLVGDVWDAPAQAVVADAELRDRGHDPAAPEPDPFDFF